MSDTHLNIFIHVSTHTHTQALLYRLISKIFIRYLRINSTNDTDLSNNTNTSGVTNALTPNSTDEYVPSEFFFGFGFGWTT